MEQSVLNEEHAFARLGICPGLFEQLGSMQQYHKLLCGAESKTVKKKSKTNKHATSMSSKHKPVVWSHGTCQRILRLTSVS